LEDDPLFNAGRGAALTSEGLPELDAAVMDGATRRAGAVAQVQRLRNPVKLARHLLENSCHVFLGGAGAEDYAKAQGLETVAPDYFITPYRQTYLSHVQAQLALSGGFGSQSQPVPVELEEPTFGTVGAVALDRHGNLAAATSTGGMTGKHPGRIGDAPVIGAGTYADNDTCAVSATGHGEWFMRTVLAYDVAAQMAYGGKTLADAADHSLIQKLTALGGRGGLVALDRRGNLTMPFNSLGMYRATVRAGALAVCDIY
jgi:beta-aspartyl-peptidase (threonine type)